MRASRLPLNSEHAPHFAVVLARTVYVVEKLTDPEPYSPILFGGDACSYLVTHAA